MSTDPPRFYRKIIRITGDDSPNVRFAKAEMAAGREPTHTIILEGVLPYADYAKRRLVWDPIRQCIGLDAMFYKGAENLLFPPLWRTKSEERARALRGAKRTATAMGVDPAEGGDYSAWTVIDDDGIIFHTYEKTPDTTVVPNRTISIIQQYGLTPSRVCFDRGGGGKQHADQLRERGFDVKTVGFGESVSIEPKRGLQLFGERLENREERFQYATRRAQMYGMLHEKLDPGDGTWAVFAVPAELERLHHEMAPIPLWYDPEGRLLLPRKHRKPGEKKEDGKPTLVDMIGWSPDCLDSLVLAVFARWGGASSVTAGAV